MDNSILINMAWFFIGFGSAIILLFLLSLFIGMDKKEEDLKDDNSRRNNV